MDSQEPISPETANSLQSTDYGHKDNNQQAVVRSPSALPVLSMAIFVLLSLGAVAFLYYQNQQLKGMLAKYQTSAASPTPTATIDPTANWKTYTNQKLGFTFQYPEKAPGVLNPLKVFEYPEIVSIGAEGTGGLFFEVDKVTNTIISKQFNYDKTQNKEYVDLKLPIPVLKSITVNTYNAQETIFPAAAQGADMRKVYFQKGNDVYTIILQPNSENIASQILSTFKFLEVPSASPTASPVSNY